MDNNTLRELQADDYDRGIIELLSELSTIDKSKISCESFEKYVKELKSDPFKYTIVILDKDLVVATATLLLETKLIHNLSAVGHIEDVVVKKEYRKIGLGKKLIEALVFICKQLECYKVILDCSHKNVSFYEKCGFKEHGVEMSLYFSE